MDLFNQLKQFDIEKVVTVAGSTLSALDEFPDRSNAATAEAGKIVVTAAGARKATQTHVAWSDLDFEGRKGEWEALADQMQQMASREGKWQERAKQAEYELFKLLNMLLMLPDPAPVLSTASALSSKVVEVEAQNRELHAAAEAAQADSKEVAALVEKHRALEAQHKELQESVAKRELEMAELQAAAAETLAARQEAAAAAAELAKLQATLRALREEHEAAQAQLFEATSKKELADGHSQRELEAALDEVEQLTQRCGELELERERFASKLASLATTSAAAAAVADSSGRGGDSSSRVVGDGWEATGDWGNDVVGPVSTPMWGGRGAAGLPMGDEFWERQLRVRSEQVVQLQAQVEAMQREVQELAARADTQARSAASQLSASQLQVTRLQSELQARPTAQDHQELRTRADALQQLVDVQIETEGWSKDLAKQALASLGASPTATNMLLQERNRALSSELALAKRVAAERAAEVEAAQAQLAAARHEAARQGTLVRRLEADLAAVGAVDTGGVGGQGTGMTRVPGGGADAGQGPASLAALKVPHGTRADNPDDGGPGGDRWGASGSVVDGGVCGGCTGVEGAPPVEPSTPPGSDGGGSLLDILVLQRDRFRQRAEQLEEEKGALEQELGSTKRQLDSVRADNVALYEKMRYLEQYSQKQLAASGGTPGTRGRTQVVRVDRDGIALPEQVGDSKRHRYQCGPLALEFGGAKGQQQQQQQQAGTPPPGPGAVGTRARGGLPGAGGGTNRLGAGLCFPVDEPDEEAGGPEARYTKAYEARLNPFAEFQQKEQDSRVKALQLHDRAVLAGSKLLVGSRFGRLFLAIYALLLHIFIMVLLYYAMSPRTRIEVVDGDALAQQQAAITGSGTAGAQRLLRGLLRTSFRVAMPGG